MSVSKKNEGSVRLAVGIDAAEGGQTATFLDTQKITTVVSKEKGEISLCGFCRKWFFKTSLSFLKYTRRAIRRMFTVRMDIDLFVWFCCTQASLCYSAKFMFFYKRVCEHESVIADSKLILLDGLP